MARLSAVKAVASAALLIAAALAPSGVQAEQVAVADANVAQVDLNEVLNAHLRSRRDLADDDDDSVTEAERKAARRERRKARRERRKARRERRERQAEIDAASGCQRSNPDIADTCPKPRDSKFVEDRYCEPTFKAGATCGCREVCNVWGDPHVSPLFSDCSTVVMRRNGRYTLYEVPVTADRPTGIKLEGYVEKRRGYKMVHEFFVDGVEVINSEQCAAGGVTGYTDEKQLQGDGGKDVTARFAAHCDDRHMWHLNITIELVDSESGADSADIDGLLSTVRARNHPNPVVRTVPDSTVYFSDDVGVCVDPIKYSVPDGGEKDESDINYTRDPFWEREECKRPTDGPDGRSCACAADCAFYGDPHVIDFYRDDDCPFHAKNVLTDPETRALYTLNPYFGAFMGVDDCEYIDSVFAVFRKPELVNAADPSDPANYDVAEYHVEDYCNMAEDVDPLLRKRILVPDETNFSPRDENEAINKRVYDPRVDSFSTGTFISLVSASDSSQTRLTAVPRDREGDLSAFAAEASAAAGGDFRPQRVIDSGGVQLVLKCHITKADQDGVPRLYWNVCVNRKRVASFDLGSDVQQGDAAFELDVNNLQTLEKTIQSAGHCALGLADPEGGGFQHRAAGDFTLFNFNPFRDTV